MKLRQIGWAVFLCAMMVSVTAGAEKVSIGIAPVFDGGGEEFGPVVAQYLTLFTYQDLLKTSDVWPSLLNPGGVYSPLDTSWLAEYVQDRTDLNLLLVATLKPVTNPAKEKWVIPVDLELLNARSGDTVASWTVSTEVDSHKTLTDFEQALMEQGSQSRYGNYVQMKDTYKIGTPSRDFEKQPMGKATARLSSSIRDTLEAKLAGLGMAKPPQPASLETSTASSCPVNVRITYDYKHSASHTYTLLANGLDQSTNLKDGVSSFSAPEGELLLQFSINDAPYKLEKEPLYQLSVVHSCKFSSLIVDLGPGGDAHTHWE